MAKVREPLPQLAVANSGRSWNNGYLDGSIGRSRATEYNLRYESGAEISRIGERESRQSLQ